MLVQIVSLLAAAAAVTAQSSIVSPAPKVTGNPNGATYVGTLPEKAGSALRGSIEASSAADGEGTKFSVSFSGLPAEGGPFMYHIHAKPVPADGNCTGTGAHLDPYVRGEAPPCDKSKLETCQTGDLSGKYGNITAQEFSAEYTDSYSATREDDPAYFGNLSFVVHLANKTRIGCANFTMKGSSDSPSSSGVPSKPSTNGTASATGTGSPVSPSATASAPPEFTNAATKVIGGTGALLMAAAAFVL